MEITFLGTGDAIPLLERAGASIAVSVGEENLLIDCGPDTVHQLIAHEINPANVQHLFFLNHHLKRNAAFVHFWMAGWTVGRDSLTVYGPNGTETLVDALDMWSEDAEYRLSLGSSPEGLTDVTYKQATTNLQVGGSNWEVTAMPVNEAEIDACAYRIEDEKDTVVIAGDVTDSSLCLFAEDADILVHGCPVAPSGEWTKKGFVWHEFMTSKENLRMKREESTTPEEAATIGAKAGVDTLVLTNFPPYGDTNKIRQRAQENFDGSIMLAKDGDRVEKHP